MAFLIDFNSEHARTILRAYFTIITLYVGFLGNSCCGLRAQLRIVRKDNVSLSHMTGWLKGFDLAKFAWKLKKLPGGWIGFLMVIVTCLSLTSDLAVAGLVQSVLVPRRCWFGNGLVLNYTSSTSSKFPSFNGAPATIANQAQATSLNNTGLEGIYRKVNNATEFRADADDYLGSWSCIDEGTLTYPTTYTANDIEKDLQTQGLLYPGTQGSEIFYVTTKGTPYDTAGDFDHLVIWGSSLADNFTGETFDIRASIDLTTSYSEPPQMWSFYCTMNASQAEYILTAMDSMWTVENWVATLQGQVYDDGLSTAYSNSGEIIARLLNTITMVAGGLNSLQSVPIGTWTDMSQGCLALRTSIPIAITSMFLAITLIAVLITKIWIFLRIWLFIARRSHKIPKHARRQVSQAPNDLVDWMTHAVRESATGGGVKMRQIKGWKFGRDGEGYGLYGPGGASSGILVGDMGMSNADFGQQKRDIRYETVEL